MTSTTTKIECSGCGGMFAPEDLDLGEDSATCEKCDGTEDTMTSTTSTRNQQIVAARIRKAAEYFAAAMLELDAAQHDANTSGIYVEQGNLICHLELGLEPEQMEWNLRLIADEIEANGRFALDD